MIFGRWNRRQLFVLTIDRPIGTITQIHHDGDTKDLTSDLDNGSVLITRKYCYDMVMTGIDVVW